MQDQRSADPTRGNIAVDHFTDHSANLLNRQHDLLSAVQIILNRDLSDLSVLKYIDRQQRVSSVRRLGSGFALGGVDAFSTATKEKLISTHRHRPPQREAWR